jgi:hypothetical protein
MLWQHQQLLNKVSIILHPGRLRAVRATPSNEVNLEGWLYDRHSTFAAAACTLAAMVQQLHHESILNSVQLRLPYVK